MEILITVLIVVFALYILVKSAKKKLKGGDCECGSCSSHCPMYNDKKEKKDKY